MYLADDMFRSTLLCMAVLEQTFTVWVPFQLEGAVYVWTFLHLQDGAVQLALQILSQKIVVPVWNYRADVVSKWSPLSAAE